MNPKKSLGSFGLFACLIMAACNGMETEPLGAGASLTGGKADLIGQCKPICDAIGSRSEGWYDSCTGELIGWAKCSGCEAKCGAAGSRSEGWYSFGPEDHCNTAGQFGNDLITWAACAPVNPEPDHKACTTDADCVEVPIDCCGCQMGGTSDVFNKNFAEQHRAQGCKFGQACLAVYLCQDTVPACIQNQCQMIPRVVTCPPVMCELYCENGFKTDDQGCPVCSCAE